MHGGGAELRVYFGQGHCSLQLHYWKLCTETGLYIKLLWPHHINWKIRAYEEVS